MECPDGPRTPSWLSSATVARDGVTLPCSGTDTALRAGRQDTGRDGSPWLQQWATGLGQRPDRKGATSSVEKEASAPSPPPHFPPCRRAENRRPGWNFYHRGTRTQSRFRDWNAKSYFLQKPRAKTKSESPVWNSRWNSWLRSGCFGILKDRSLSCLLGAGQVLNFLRHSICSSVK